MKALFSSSFLCLAVALNSRMIVNILTLIYNNAVGLVMILNSELLSLSAPRPAITSCALKPSTPVHLRSITDLFTLFSSSIEQTCPCDVVDNSAISKYVVAPSYM